MKRFILIPDSFKGTLSSTEITEIMGEKLRRRWPDAEIVAIPVADGGEGSVACFLTALGGELVKVPCTGPLGDTVDGFFGMLADGETAVVEMAAAAGLPLVEDRRDPEKATTFGVGELILGAVKGGAKTVIVGLGGSATNDFGCGAAAAVGIRFLASDGTEFVPTGGTLAQIHAVDFSRKDPRLQGVRIVTMCDIDNPPYGEHGAAAVFGPQKGADPAAVERLDAGVRHLCTLLERDHGMSLSQLPGGGAAGAMGAGMVAFFGSELQMGIETVLDTVHFDELLTRTDLVLTGEGKLDSQSLRGKVVIGVARRAKKQNVPVVAVVGGADGDLHSAYGEGVTAVFTINRLPEDFSVSRYKSAENLAFTMENLVRLLDVKGKEE